eukprot:tig00021348_g20577.t1
MEEDDTAADGAHGIFLAAAFILATLERDLQLALATSVEAAGENGESAELVISEPTRRTQLSFLEYKSMWLSETVAGEAGEQPSSETVASLLKAAVAEARSAFKPTCRELREQPLGENPAAREARIGAAYKAAAEAAWERVQQLVEKERVPPPLLLEACALASGGPPPTARSVARAPADGDDDGPDAGEAAAAEAERADRAARWHRQLVEQQLAPPERPAASGASPPSRAQRRTPWRTSGVVRSVSLPPQSRPAAFHLPAARPRPGPPAPSSSPSPAGAGDSSSAGSGSDRQPPPRSQQRPPTGSPSALYFLDTPAPAPAAPTALRLAAEAPPRAAPAARPGPAPPPAPAPPSRSPRARPPPANLPGGVPHGGGLPLLPDPPSPSRLPRHGGHGGPKEGAASSARSLSAALLRSLLAAGPAPQPSPPPRRPHPPTRPLSPQRPTCTGAARARGPRPAARPPRRRRARGLAPPRAAPGPSPEPPSPASPQAPAPAALLLEAPLAAAGPRRSWELRHSRSASSALHGHGPGGFSAASSSSLRPPPSPPRPAAAAAAREAALLRTYPSSLALAVAESLYAPPRPVPSLLRGSASLRRLHAAVAGPAAHAPPPGTGPGPGGARAPQLYS